MKIAKIQGVEINLDGAKQMKKTEFVKAFDRIGKDGSAMWDDLQKILKPKKSED